MLYLGLNGELLDLRDKEHVVEEKRVAVRCTTAFCNKKVWRKNSNREQLKGFPNILRILKRNAFKNTIETR